MNKRKINQHNCEQKGCFLDGSVECHVPGDECEHLWADEKFITLQCIHPAYFEHGDQPCKHMGEPWKCEKYKKQNIVEHLCPEHAFRNGYCICCGEFWGSVGDFDFGNGLCEHCQEACDLEKGELEYDEYTD